MYIRTLIFLANSEKRFGSGCRLLNPVRWSIRPGLGPTPAARRTKMRLLQALTQTVKMRALDAEFLMM